MMKNGIKFNFEGLLIMMLLIFRENIKVSGDECCQQCVEVCEGSYRCMYECFLHCP